MALLHLVIKIPENGGWKVFRVEKPQNKVLLLFFICENANSKVWPTFLDAVDQQARYSSFIVSVSKIQNEK